MALLSLGDAWNNVFGASGSLGGRTPKYLRSETREINDEKIRGCRVAGQNSSSAQERRDGISDKIRKFFMQGQFPGR